MLLKSKNALAWTPAFIIEIKKAGVLLGVGNFNLTATPPIAPFKTPMALRFGYVRYGEGSMSMQRKKSSESPGKGMTA